MEELFIRNEFLIEILRILKTSRDALTTQEILRKVTNKCPNASISLLVALMDSGIIVGKWSVGKGYLWTLPDSNYTNKLLENNGILPRM